MWSPKTAFFLCLSLAFQIGYSQINTGYVKADPYYLTEYEKSVFEQSIGEESLNLRPFLLRGPEKGVQITLNALSRFYYNDNVPNLENTSELWVGKGATSFSSLHLNIIHRNFFFSIEPYFQYSENLKFTSYHVVRDHSVYNPEIVWKFNVLNDGPGRGLEPVNELRLRETQLYIHYKGIGGGFSNAGMWWGPGIHSTLNMTTNTSGFSHIVLGTLKEQRYKRFGINMRYVLGELSRNETKPYFTALLGSFTYYNEPAITLGFTRVFLNGGVNLPGISIRDAALLPFQSFFKKNLYQDDGVYGFGNKDDQTASIFLSILFLESKLKLFMEYGWNDHRWDWYDLRAHPDHSGASVIGFRKYGIFNKPDLVFGFEYTNLSLSPFYLQRATPDWYGRKTFFYSTNDGRRFAAHSGSDSDDMLIYLAWIKPEHSLRVGFDYERHGIIYSVKLLEDTNAFHFPEDKLELQIEYSEKLKYGKLYAYYEYEFAENLGSPAQLVSPHVDRPVRKANVFGIGFESSLYHATLGK